LNHKKLLVSIVENWPVKVLAIVLALFLFVFHRLNTMTTRPLSIPLAIETNSSLTPASAYPQNVRVSLRGEDDSIKSIADGDIEAYVDFTRYENEGLYSAPVQIRKKGSALGIEPLEITVNPLKITVHLDRRITKTFPLAAQLRGRVADGFDLVSYSISPLEITAVGPLSSLELISEIETDPIDLDGRTNDFTIQVSIANPNALFVLRGNETAEVSCVILPSVAVRSIEGIPIAIIALAPALEADLGGRTGSVRLEGRESLLNDFQPPPGFFTVDCSRIVEPGTYTEPVMIDLPADFSLSRREPEEVTLTVSYKEYSF
jgi:YbbR domain-containing protein